MKHLQAVRREKPAIGSPAEILASLGIGAGLQSLLSLPVVLFMQLLWGIILLYTGRSTVTGARVTFHLHRDRI